MGHPRPGRRVRTELESLPLPGPGLPRPSQPSAAAGRAARRARDSEGLFDSPFHRAIMMTRSADCAAGDSTESPWQFGPGEGRDRPLSHSSPD